MSNIKTGGPAFPRAASSTANGFSSGADGMTLRDYFAAKAMQTLISGNFDWYERHAQYAYEMADAMLKAREQS